MRTDDWFPKQERARVEAALATYDQYIAARIGRRAAMRAALAAADVVDTVRASHARLLEACRIMAILIKEGPDARYTVTPGAALNSFVEEVLDPILASAEGGGDE